MPRTLDTSHPLYDTLRLVVAVEDDGVTIKDFWTPTRVITKDAGVTTKVGNLGYAFTLIDAGGGTTPRGITFGTRPWLENGTGESMTIAVFFDRWVTGYNSASYPPYNTSVGFEFLMGTGTNKATPAIGSGGTPVITASSAIPANTPAMVAMSYTRGGNMTLNVNGVLQGSASWPGFDETSIVALRGTSGNSIVADVFAFCTFDRVLTSGELLSLWQSCTGNGNFALFTGSTGGTELKLARIRLFKTDGTPASNMTLKWTLSQFGPPNTNVLAGSTGITDVDGWFEPMAAGYPALDVFTIGDNGYLVCTDAASATTFSDPPALAYAGPCPIVGVTP